MQHKHCVFILLMLETNKTYYYYYTNIYTQHFLKFIINFFYKLKLSWYCMYVCMYRFFVCMYVSLAEFPALSIC